jgi:hypothetical protein
MPTFEEILQAEKSFLLHMVMDNGEQRMDMQCVIQSTGC